MTASFTSRVLDALAAILEGTPGITTFVTDSARVVSRIEGVALSLDIAGDASDVLGKTCDIYTTLPIVATIYANRLPNDPPNWELLDPYYVEVHRRIMADRRLGGLAIDIFSTGRTYESDIKVCAVGCQYAVKYQTRQEDVSLQ